MMLPCHSPTMRVDAPAPEIITMALADWYRRHARDLPWRSPPGTAPPPPYRVWLSEIMLQQTTVAAVRSYFEAFTRRWPTVTALAAADDAAVMQAWAGLGYYARARNLLACARTVATDHDGQFPDTEAGLRALPGIGAYTAAAVAAIAFDRRAVVVDGNVERVTSRLFAESQPLPTAKQRLYALAATLTPMHRAGDHAQAMMDLGATICTPRNPACGICPLLGRCAAQTEGEPTRYPVKAAKPERPLRYGSIYWLESAGRVLLETRPPRGLLGGMRALPSDIWATLRPAPAPPIAAEWITLPGIVSHGFTHFELALTVHFATVDAACAPPGDWVAVSDILAVGLPTVFAKAARHALDARTVQTQPPRLD